MHSMLNSKQTDDPHDFLVVAPDVIPVAPANKELSNPAHEVVRHSSDSQTHTGPDLPAGPSVPPVDTAFRAAAVDNVQALGHRRSIGGRAVRAFAALLLAACIGIAAFVWQSSGNMAKQVIGKWAPQLVMSSWLPLAKPGLSAQPATPAIEAAAASTAAPQPAPLAQTAPQDVLPTAAALSPDSAQLLQSMARDLATVGQQVEQLKASIEQLKAGQQQMSREVARASEAKASEAKASEQNLRPRISAAPPRPAAAPARKPMPPYPPRQAAAAPTLPPAAAPYVPRQVEPQPQATAQPPDEDPELSPVPRPPMPLR